MSAVAMKVSTDPWASGVLKKEVHHRLVASLDVIARQAMIQPRWIYTPLAETCGASEVDYVRRFKFHQHEGIAGLAIVGEQPASSVENRMSAMAGALLRNFIDARVMTLGSFVEAAEDDDVPLSSCVLIPNFCVGVSPKAKGGSKGAWQIASLLDALILRQTQGLQTVIYANSLEAIGTEYGVAVKNHVANHYAISKA